MLGQGVTDLGSLAAELRDMADVLLGHKESPIDAGIMTLMELADAFHARAMDMTMQIQAKERRGSVVRGSAAYKFRTGELRSFTELAKRSSDLGSRRVTFASLQLEAERTGRSNAVESFYSEGDDDDA